MYSVKEISKHYRTSPWNIHYNDRIENLELAKKVGKKTIAFVYPFFDSSTFRYRGYNIAETLEYSFSWAASYFELNDLPELSKKLDVVDVVVIIRCAWELETAEFVEKVKKKGKRLIYDVDDLIYNPKYMPVVIKTLDLDRMTEWDFWFSLTQRNHMIAELCDGFITTNEYLAECLRNDYNKPCYVIRNYLNWIQEEVSENYLNQKLDMKTDDVFEIGYFSGSPTHVKDIMVVMPMLEEFFQMHNNVKLKIVGYMNLPEKYNKWIEKDRIEFVPFQTFVGLQHEQAKVDVNIVPLVNNEFSNCKSELKYFESGIVGTVTCATPTYTYKNAIKHCENGYLCEKEDWLPVLEKIYREGTSKEQMRMISKKCLEEYGSRSQLKTVEDIFDKIYNISII